MTARGLEILEGVVCRKKAALDRQHAMSHAAAKREDGVAISAYRCPFQPDHRHVGRGPSMQTLKRIAEVLRDRHNANLQ